MTALALDARGGLIQAVGFGDVDNVTFSGTAADSENFPAGVNLVMVVATEDCWLREYTASTAVSATTGTRLVSNLPVFVKVVPGNHFSVLQVSTSGSLNITYCI